MRLREIGEFGLIREISRWLPAGKRVIKGIGDDAAVIRHGKDTYALFTTDMLIEGVHFRLAGTKPALIGRKALAVNISDIAAMGGVPRYGVVALGVPPALSVASLRQIYGGMRKLADKFKIGLVGGDTNRSEKLIINISLTGEVEKHRLTLRSNSKVGDAVFVTGRLGGSLESGKHLTFTPRVKEAQFLVKNFRINSMIDISDGLVSDLMRITESSNVGVSLDGRDIPVNRNCSIKDALFDGEDFELLFTVPERQARAVLKKWPFKVKLTRIGKITGRRKAIELATEKGSRRITGGGFRHF